MSMRNPLPTAALALCFSAANTAPAISDSNVQTVTPEPDELSFHCDMPDTTGLDLPDLIEKIYPANVLITTRIKKEMPFGQEPRDGETPSYPAPGRSIGSGFIIDKDQNFVVTNAHVLEGDGNSAEGYSFTVTFFDPNKINYKGYTVDADLVGIDSSADGSVDLAVLQISDDDLRHELDCVSFANSATIRVGEDVFAIGNPLGNLFTATFGHISHTLRNIGNPLYDFIQTDTPINKGNSGGALYDPTGKVAGVNTAIISQSGDSAGIGFAIPSNVVIKIIDQLIKHGEIKRGWLGVQIQELNKDEYNDYAAANNGVIVKHVDPRGPSFEGGLKKGDIIISINGNPISDSLSLIRTVSDITPGTIASVLILRDMDMLELPIELGDRDIGIPRQQEETTPPEGENVPDEGAPDDTPDDAPDSEEKDPKTAPSSDKAPYAGRMEFVP